MISRMGRPSDKLARNAIKPENTTVLPARCPGTMGEYGRQLYGRIRQDYPALRESDLCQITLLCTSHQIVEECRDKITDEGLFIVNAKGEPITHPAAALLEKMSRVVNVTMQKLGIARSSRVTFEKKEDMPTGKVTTMKKHRTKIATPVDDTPTDLSDRAAAALAGRGAKKPADAMPDKIAAALAARDRIRSEAEDTAKSDSRGMLQ